MEPIHTPCCSKIKILIVMAVLFVMIGCISLIKEDSEESALQKKFSTLIHGYDVHGPALKHPEELVLFSNKGSEESVLQITFSMTIHRFDAHVLAVHKYDANRLAVHEYDAHGFRVVKQFGTLESQGTYDYLTHCTILHGLLEAQAQARVQVLQFLDAKDFKNAGVVDGLVAEDSRILWLLKNFKHWGAAVSSSSIKCLGSPLLYGIVGVFFCAASLLLKWYKIWATYGCCKASLEFVKEIQTMQLLKIETKGSFVPSVQFLNECSPIHAVSSSNGTKDYMMNDTRILGNSLYIPKINVRKCDSASSTNQESTNTAELHMENSSYRSLTIMGKGKDKKQKNVIPTRKSDRTQNLTKSSCSQHKQDVDKKQQKSIPLRRSERIRNLTKSVCAHR